MSKYAHIHKAFVVIEQLRWARIPLPKSGQISDHSHSFYRDGDDKRVVKVEVDATQGKDKLTAKVSAGISDLLGSFFPSLGSPTNLVQYSNPPDQHSQILSETNTPPSSK